MNPGATAARVLTPVLNPDASRMWFCHRDEMGFLDRIKKFFDTGGIKVAVAAGKTFRWSDDILPVDITVTNSADEPRTVNSVRLQFVEYDRENPATMRKVHGRYEGMNLFLNEPFTVEAGSQPSQHVDMPLSVTGVAEKIGAEAPEWLTGLSNVVNTVKELNRDNEWYQLRVIPDVEGFSATKVATHRIRNLRAGEWGSGIFRTRIGG